MATDAKTWLAGNRDYNDGLALLKEWGRSGWIISMLEKGPDHYNTLKLTAEIEKISEVGFRISDFGIGNGGLASAAMHIAKVSGFTTMPEPAAATQPQGEDFADVKLLLQKKALIKLLFTEINFLRAKLPLLGAGDELHACAKEILLKDFKRRELWDEINYFEREGVWFVPARIADPGDAVDVHDKKSREQKIKNLMANRSKKLAYLDKPQSAGKKKFYQELVDKLTAEIEELKKFR